jgi:hypothetical protein
VLDVTLLVDGVAVFVGIEVHAQIYGLLTNCAEYFRERVTTHKYLLWTATSIVA